MSKQHLIYMQPELELNLADSHLEAAALSCVREMLADWSRRDQCAAYREEEHYNSLMSHWYAQGCGKAGVIESDYYCRIFQRAADRKLQSIAEEKGNRPNLVRHYDARRKIIEVA